MEILAPNLIEMFHSFLWPMIRMSAFFLTAPFFGLSAFNLRAKIILSVVIAWILLPLIDVPKVDPFSFGAVWFIAREVVIGAFMGLFLQIILATLIIAGQIIAGGMGLSMANMIDPNMGNIPTLSQFLLIVGILIFISLGGHLILLSILVSSYTVLPIGQLEFSVELISGLVAWSSIMFLGAVSIAFPILFGLLLTNMSLGIISRTAPSLNVFAVGFPALIPLGLLMLLLSVGIWLDQTENLWFLAFSNLRDLLGL